MTRQRLTPDLIGWSLFVFPSTPSTFSALSGVLHRCECLPKLVASSTLGPSYQRRPYYCGRCSSEKALQSQMIQPCILNLLVLCSWALASRDEGAGWRGVPLAAKRRPANAHFLGRGMSWLYLQQTSAYGPLCAFGTLLWLEKSLQSLSISCLLPEESLFYYNVNIGISAQASGTDKLVSHWIQAPSFLERASTYNGNLSLLK